METRKAQVWIETVIYTLIGLAIIGILLAVSKPKFDSMRDQMAIQQTIESVNNINAKILEVKNLPANKRVIELRVSKGIFRVDATNNRITWQLDSRFLYSELGTPVKVGSLMALTSAGNPYRVEIWSEFPSVDLVSGGQEVRDAVEASTPYQLYIENKGISADGKPVIDITIK
jgi:type II secretory pathway pseudopilin PulG